MLKCMGRKIKCNSTRAKIKALFGPFIFFSIDGESLDRELTAPD